MLDDFSMISIQIGKEQIQVGTTMTQYELVHNFRLQVMLLSVDIRVIAYLVSGDEVPHVLFHHLPFDGEALHIRSC